MSRESKEILDKNLKTGKEWFAYILSAQDDIEVRTEIATHLMRLAQQVERYEQWLGAEQMLAKTLEAHWNGEFSEGYACDLLGMDRIEYRDHWNPYMRMRELQENGDK